MKSYFYKHVWFTLPRSYVILVHLNIDDLPTSQSYFMIFKPFIKQQIEEV